MNNLASVLYDRNQYEEAEQLFREVLILKEKVLGKEHPDTLISMNHLGWILYDQKKNEEAERIARETLMLRKKVLGKEHPDTLLSREFLAATLKVQGKDEEAEELIAAVRMTEQNETNTSTYLADGLTPSDSGDVIRPSSAGTKGARQGAQWLRKGKGHEGDGSDVGEGIEKDRRVARIPQWARRTANSLKFLPLAPKRSQDHPASSASKPTKSANAQPRMQSSPGPSTE